MSDNHIEFARRAVANWPDWKKRVFGGGRGMTNIISKAKLLEYLDSIVGENVVVGIMQKIQSGAFDVATDADVAEIEKALAEERAAHNAHATELCLQDQEIKRLHAEIERLRARAERMNYTEKDIKTAMTRELTDERVAVAAAYWLDASPHERWEPDGIILARYARHAMAEIERLRAALEEALEALEWIRDAGADMWSIIKARDAIHAIRGGGAE